MTCGPEDVAFLMLRRPARRDGGKAYLVGGGIASMTAAAFMIRDGNMLGSAITS